MSAIKPNRIAKSMEVHSLLTVTILRMYTINSVVLYRQTPGHPATQDTSQPSPYVHKVFHAPNIEDRWQKTGQEAPDTSSNILVYTWDNYQEPTNKLEKEFMRGKRIKHNS